MGFVVLDRGHLAPMGFGVVSKRRGLGVWSVARGSVRAGGARGRGFGVGNFKALFEAIERDQRLRGNL